MKAKYIITSITCCIMFITCYKASQITSSASNIGTTNNIIITSKPYVSSIPSLVPATVAPYTNETKTTTNNSADSQIKDNQNTNSNNKKNTSTGSVSNTVAPLATSKVITTTTPSTTVKPNTPIKVPTIYTPSLTAQTVYTNNSKTVTIDASNKNSGYLGIKYSGNNKKVKVQIKKDNQTYNYDLPSNNQYTIYPLQLGNGNYSVNVLENVIGTQYSSIILEKINVNINNLNNVFLYPNQYVWFTQNSNIVKQSARVCHGYTKNIDKISAIFKYVTSHITYDYDKANTVQSGYLPNVDEILKIRKGICFDYAALMAAMCRAQGIPTKLITGYVSPNGVYHAWNEVYTEEKGWITVSFYLNKVGFNLIDPTFYSNMNDNDSAAKYIGNGSNYKLYHIY